MAHLEKMNNPKHFAAAAWRYEHQLPYEETVAERYDGEDIQEDVPYDDATETQLAREAEARDIVTREPSE